MMKLLLGGVVILFVVLLAGFWMWRKMTGPLYQPGDVRAGKDLAEPLTPPQTSGTRWLVAPNIELHHFEEGAGTPVLVVHGGPGFPTTQPWRAGKLLTGYRTIYYHQRGCGLSTRPIRSFSGSNMYANMRKVHQTLGLPAQIGDIERIRRILGVERLIVIGHSFGAELAALWAAEFPEHVRALVCVAPADLAVLPPKDDSGNLFELVRQRLPAKLKPEYERYLAEYFDFRRAFARSEEESSAFYGRLGKYWGAGGAPRGPSAIDAAGYEPLGVYCSMGAHHDYRGAFAAVQAPVLVIHGGTDLQPESVSRNFAARFANHRTVRIDNASHFVFDDQPEAFAAAVNQFLGGLQP
jgi:proline iminopeptidase